MRRPAPLARLSAAFLLLPALGGCLGGYVYPTATYIPRVPVGLPAADQVHAFRFDIRDYSGSVDLSGGDEYLMHELPLNGRGNVPAQTMVRFGHGWWGVYHTLGYRQRMNPTMRVRLYRRGYETVQVGPWDWHGLIDWKPVDTLAGREKAIDDLISTRETNELYKINPAVWGNTRADYNLEAPQTPAQRDALLFVANEYDDLAEQSQFHAKEDIARLRDKARQLRELAGGPK